MPCWQRLGVARPPDRRLLNQSPCCRIGSQVLDVFARGDAFGASYLRAHLTVNQRRLLVHHLWAALLADPQLVLMADRQPVLMADEQPVLVAEQQPD